MRKKKKHKEDHIDETWLVPYADLLTLLLALFIVLFAISKVDQEKFAELANVMRGEFSSGEGIMESGTTISPEEQPLVGEEQEEKEEEQQEETEDAEKKRAEIEKLAKIQQKINGYITENELTDVLDTKLTDEGLLISILNDVSFDSGSAEVSGDGQEIAKEVSNFLYTNPPHEITVSGHTDNQPIHSSEFKSNWELSVMRAVNFMRLLLDNEDLDERLFSAKGYGEYEPIAPNDSPKNREKNRRVEVLILPNYD
ncbi:flagellar motor protein MotB [Sediminibacillus dalangtanensis]|uniref:Flagellar motor protein MotB n=1 Tax=Sediminibacillus dalangtanensis TaxID=2729421 RepID=A0ABX7VU74_9BACI|nr:flagellar motor protein MotB [Sediminibacillus dalangtanensis]QTN00508.1 flagellar motor protein MotB [Sediminibacillus dalangtanensis]